MEFLLVFRQTLKLTVIFFNKCASNGEIIFWVGLLKAKNLQERFTISFPAGMYWFKVGNGKCVKTIQR